MLVGVQESRVESAVASGAAAGPRMVEMRHVGLGSHAAGAAAVSLRTPRKRGFDSHGGVFDHLESTSCKQDKGRLQKFLPFRRKDTTLLRSKASAKKQGESRQSPVLYLGLKWRISGKVFKKRNLNI